MLLMRPVDVKSEERAINPDFEHNPALLFKCKAVARDIRRCKNWESVCMDFGEWGTCHWMNPPKTLHWKRK